MPATSCRCFPRPGKRTRLRPACPCTESCPAIRQVGETCLTTKITRVSRGSTKVNVVPRRRFGPEVEIQDRDEWMLSIRRGSGRLRFDELELPAEEGTDEELPRIEPTVAAAKSTEEATVGAEGVELPLPAAGAGRAGAGAFGLAGTGTATGGDGIVTLGTGTGSVGTGTGTVGTGTGTVSARACPATRPAPTKTAATATDRISE